MPGTVSGEGSGSDLRGRLTTPAAAAWAGVAFAVLFGVSIVLVRLSVPPNPLAEPDWLDRYGTRLAWALRLMPFAGLAFLWFLGVVRDRLGEHEDRFLATVTLGSGLLFLAMTFAAMAIGGGLLVAGTGSDGTLDPELVRFGRATMVQIANVYALRMAGAFMISLGTIWLRTGLMPRWLVVLTYLLALALLLVTSLSLWATLAFPAWVLLVSGVFLVRKRTGLSTPT